MKEILMNGAVDTNIVLPYTGLSVYSSGVMSG
jgi:hypothetical protein